MRRFIHRCWVRLWHRHVWEIMEEARIVTTIFPDFGQHIKVKQPCILERC